MYVVRHPVRLSVNLQHQCCKRSKLLERLCCKRSKLLQWSCCKRSKLLSWSPSYWGNKRNLFQNLKSSRSFQILKDNRLDTTVTSCIFVGMTFLGFAKQKNIILWKRKFLDVWYLTILVFKYMIIASDKYDKIFIKR